MNAPMPGKTLLIVEDEILPAMALQAELQDAGYNVMDLTGRHQEALTAARECRPDLADDGIALAGDLKGLGIPVLFISGQISRARTAQTVAIGSMPKPYSTVDMVMAVTYLLARLRGEHSPPRPPQLEVFEPAVEAAVQGSA
jgi:DNA-binding response OmpR family regulator